MSDSTPRCGHFEDDLAGLATGTLTGRPRSEVLEHLQSCPACAAELDALSLTIDALMTLAPDVEPPAGFADRTIARMKEEAPALGADSLTERGGSRERSRPGHLRLARPLLVAAAALLVGVGIGMAASTNKPPGASTTTAVRVASLHSTDGTRGEAVLTSGHPGLLMVSVDYTEPWSRVTCQVTLSNGHRRVVGRYAMSSGYASWAIRLPVSATSVRSVQLLDTKGATVAWARLPKTTTS
jgi:hypothetical protein